MQRKILTSVSKSWHLWILRTKKSQDLEQGSIFSKKKVHWLFLKQRCERCSDWCRYSTESTTLHSGHLCCIAAKHGNRLNGFVCSLTSWKESRTPLEHPPRASQSTQLLRYSTFFLSAAAIQIVVSYLSPFSQRALSKTSQGSLFNFVFVNGRSRRYYRTAGSPARLHSAGLWTSRHQGFQTRKGKSSETLLSLSPFFSKIPFIPSLLWRHFPAEKRV